MPELLLTTSTQREKLLGLDKQSLEWHGVSIMPDFPLNPPLIEENGWDEIHCYDWLEVFKRDHFFLVFSNLWYGLKPDGYLYGITPGRHAPMAFANPFNQMTIWQESLIFLDRERFCQTSARHPLNLYTIKQWKGDFKIIYSQDTPAKHLFCLQAIKPPRKWETLKS